MEISGALVLGDSVARGVVLDSAGQYVPIKESFASLAAERLGLRLINKARFGCTIEKGLNLARRMLEIGGERYREGDLALLEFGGNDCDFRWDRIAADPAARHEPATPLPAFSKAYIELIALLRRAGLKPVILTLPPLEPRKYFAWLTRTGLDKEAILSWLGGVQTIFSWHRSYDEELRSIARREGCPLADIRGPFLATSDYSEYLCEDGIHPNRRGHALACSSLVDLARHRLGASPRAD